MEDLEHALITTKHNIVSSKEILDAEDHALVSHVNQMVDYYKYGYIIPIEELDACVLAGHIPSIIYRVGQASLRPMSKEVEIYLQSALEKIFRSGDGKAVSRLSRAFAFTYDNSNPFEFTEEQIDSLSYLATFYNERISDFVRFGENNIHVYDFSVLEWKKIVSELTECMRDVFLNEFKEHSFIQINKKMFITTRLNGNQIPYLSVYYRNTQIADINMNANRGKPFEELLDIFLDVQNHLKEFKNDADHVKHQFEFLSEIEEIYTNINWLNLPTKRSELRTLLFNKKNEGSPLDFEYPPAQK
jgi:hypothetical protein